MENVLVIGAAGQVGSELVTALRKLHGENQVIASDLHVEKLEGLTEQLDVLNKEALHAIISKYKITTIYHLAAIISAVGEKNPKLAWEVNMNSLVNVLEASKELGVKKIFWPSSIAVFGPSSPKINTPQNCLMDPNTMYGITKLAGERLCEYYHNKFDLDIRSIRYPGLISWKTLPGGGTTDYAVHIFHEAIKNKKYSCFLKEDATLPMMLIDDAIRATLEIMHAPKENIQIRTSYNLAGISFSPKEIAESIKMHIPEFEIEYAPDFRQAIAESWPQSIEDSSARKDWNWSPKYDMNELVKTMLDNVKKFYS
jgi:nucleoside-diphosphate-sugar epimerase